jgi:hypothetical protein
MGFSSDFVIYIWLSRYGRSKANGLKKFNFKNSDKKFHSLNIKTQQNIFCSAFQDCKHCYTANYVLHAYDPGYKSIHEAICSLFSLSHTFSYFKVDLKYNERRNVHLYICTWRKGKRIEINNSIMSSISKHMRLNWVRKLLEVDGV